MVAYYKLQIDKRCGHRGGPSKSRLTASRAVLDLGKSDTNAKRKLSPRWDAQFGVARTIHGRRTGMPGVSSDSRPSITD
ncbi:MAG: hypothetical protein ABR985_07755 [Methanotrichaceae archaeon]